MSQFPESIEDPRDHARPEVHNDIFSDDLGVIDPALEIIEALERNDNPSIEVRMEIRLTRVQGSDWWVSSSDHARVIQKLREGMTLLSVRTETRDPDGIEYIHWVKAKSPQDLRESVSPFYMERIDKIDNIFFAREF